MAVQEWREVFHYGRTKPRASDPLKLRLDKLREYRNTVGYPGPKA
jgi:hypothetical protein